jgi:hypothetical protein
MFRAAHPRSILVEWMMFSDKRREGGYGENDGLNEHKKPIELEVLSFAKEI